MICVIEFATSYQWDQINKWSKKKLVNPCYFLEYTCLNYPSWSLHKLFGLLDKKLFLFSIGNTVYLSQL